MCEYFKAGQCTKGFKCKFSHDLNAGRRTQKIDLFQDKCAPTSHLRSERDTVSLKRASWNVHAEAISMLPWVRLQALADVQGSSRDL